MALIAGTFKVRHDSSLCTADRPIYVAIISDVMAGIVAGGSAGSEGFAVIGVNYSMRESLSEITS